MKNLEVLNLYNTLVSCKNIEAVWDNKVRFLYAINRNISVLQNYANNLTDIIKESPELAEYNQKRQELLTKFSIKNEDGSPKTTKVTIGDKFYFNYEIDQSLLEEFNVLSTNLSSEYSDTILAQTNAEKEFDKILNEESDEFNFYNLKIEWIPKEINNNDFTHLMSIAVE